MRLFEIARKEIEDQLQNLNIEQLRKTLDHMSLSFAIEILSIDKNMDLLTKKSQFNFLTQLFDKLSTLNPKEPILEMLDITPEKIKQKILIPDLIVRENNKLIPFIERVMDLSISKAKKHNMKEIKEVMKIAKDFHIDETKLVTWISKITAYSENINLLSEVSKLTIWNNKELKERFVSIILNKSDNLKMLNQLFSLHEETIYDVYIKNKYNHKIWNFLSIKSTDSGYGLPYVPEEKMKWFEDKKIGYRNHPVYFELYRLNSLYRIDLKYNPSKVDAYLNDEYYQQVIAKSLQVYHEEFLPTQQKMIEENKILPENKRHDIYKWTRSTPMYSILSLYENDKNFYEFCKSYDFKVVLEESLEEENKSAPKRKI